MESRILAGRGAVSLANHAGHEERVSHLARSRRRPLARVREVVCAGARAADRRARGSGPARRDEGRQRRPHGELRPKGRLRAGLRLHRRDSPRDQGRLPRERAVSLQVQGRRGAWRRAPGGGRGEEERLLEGCGRPDHREQDGRDARRALQARRPKRQDLRRLQVCNLQRSELLPERGRHEPRGRHEVALARTRLKWGAEPAGSCRRCGRSGNGARAPRGREPRAHPRGAPRGRR